MIQKERSVISNKHTRRIYHDRQNNPKLLNLTSVFDDLERYNRTDLILNPKLKNLIDNLNKCGKCLTKIEYYCNKCLKEHDNYNLLHKEQYKHLCNIKYCSKIECISDRFSHMVERLKSIKRFERLRTLQHFVIGFPLLSVDNFIQNFLTYKKRFEYVLTNFFKKVRSQNIKIDGIRVLDISFTKENNVYIHYHFAICPFKHNHKNKNLTTIQSIRKDMIQNQKVKTPFHVQFFKHAKKSSIFNYLTIRAIGLYKFDDDHKQINSKEFKPQKLEQSIKENKFFMLKDILSIEDYLKYFYNKKHFSVLGNVKYPAPYGSNIRYNSLNLSCDIHGKLDKSDIKFITIQEIEEKPPPD